MRAGRLPGRSRGRQQQPRNRAVVRHLAGPVKEFPGKRTGDHAGRRGGCPGYQRLVYAPAQDTREPRQAEGRTVPALLQEKSARSPTRPPPGTAPSSGCSTIRAFGWPNYVILRLSDFDRKQGVIIVKGKGSKERRIALGSNCLRNLLYYLDRHRADEEELGEWGNAAEDHLFLSETRLPLTKNGVTLLFKRIRE